MKSVNRYWTANNSYNVKKRIKILKPITVLLTRSLHIIFVRFLRIIAQVKSHNFFKFQIAFILLHCRTYDLHECMLVGTGTRFIRFVNDNSLK